MDTKNKDEAMTGEDLDKSLDKLEAASNADDPVARKDELLAKAKESDLEKAERDELFALMGGPTETEETTTVGDDLIKSMTDDGNQGLQEALDVSPYLREQHDALVKSLKDVGDHIEKSDKRQYEISQLQSRAIVDMGHLVKGIAERMKVIETQPVGGPKSRGVTTEPDQALNKSFAGDEPEGEQLTKSDISDALDGVMAESMEDGRNGLTKSGQDILLEISKFEQSSKISPDMFKEVKRFISQRSAAH